jgi:hypothetical protein
MRKRGCPGYLLGLIAQEDLVGPDIRYFVYPLPVNIGRPRAKCASRRPPGRRLSCGPSDVGIPGFPVGPTRPDPGETAGVLPPCMRGRSARGRTGRPYGTCEPVSRTGRAPTRVPCPGEWPAPAASWGCRVLRVSSMPGWRLARQRSHAQLSECAQGSWRSHTRSAVPAIRECRRKLDVRCPTCPVARQPLPRAA